MSLINPRVAENVQHELPEALPGSPANQATETGLHHTHPAMDVRSVVQGELPSPDSRTCLMWYKTSIKNHFNDIVSKEIWKQCLCLPVTGSSLRLPAHCHAVLYICNYWNAGELRPRFL